MPGFLTGLLKRLLHVHPNTKHDSPFPTTYVACGQKTQFALEVENLPILEKDGITLIQSIVGASLYFGHIIDNTVIISVNDIGLQQSAPTEKH